MADSNVKTTDVNVGSGAVATDRATYYGFTLENGATDTEAVVTIYDNTAASGKVLEKVRVATEDSVRAYYGPQGIRANLGITVDIEAGAVTGSIRHG